MVVWVQSVTPFVVPAAAVSTETLDPTAGNKSTNIVLSNGNLTATVNPTADAHARSVHSKASGKFYFEVTINAYSRGLIGICNASATQNNYAGIDANGLGSFGTDGVWYYTGLNNGAGTTYTAGNVVCIAVDFTAQLIWQRVDGGVWNNNAGNNPATGTGGINFSPGGLNITGPYFAAVSPCTTSDTQTINFGATTFAQTPPSGFGTW